MPNPESVVTFLVEIGGYDRETWESLLVNRFYSLAEARESVWGMTPRRQWRILKRTVTNEVMEEGNKNG